MDQIKILFYYKSFQEEIENTVKIVYKGRTGTHPAADQPLPGFLQI